MFREASARHGVHEQTSLWMQMTSLAKTQTEWVQFYLRPIVKPAVPKDIFTLLKVARATMIYGWYFYPLVTLSAERCWLVLEPAVRLRYKLLGVQTPRRSRDGREPSVAQTYCASRKSSNSSRSNASKLSCSMGTWFNACNASSIESRPFRVDASLSLTWRGTPNSSNAT